LLDKKSVSYFCAIPKVIFAIQVVVGEESQLLKGIYAQQVGLIDDEHTRDLFALGQVFNFLDFNQLALNVSIALGQVFNFLVYLDVEFGPSA